MPDQRKPEPPPQAPPKDSTGPGGAEPVRNLRTARHLRWIRQSWRRWRNPPGGLPAHHLQAPLDGDDGVHARLRLHGDPHVHRHAHLRRAGAVARRVGQSERRQLQGSRPAGQLQLRFLPDAVRHPEEPVAGAAHDRRAEDVGFPGVRWRGRGDARGKPASKGVGETLPRTNAAAGPEETAAQSAAIDAVARRPDGRPHPQQPPHRRAIRFG